MIFRSATTKSVKADFSKGEITLTFTVPFDEDERETASALAKYVDANAGDVRLEIYPRQMSMYTTDHHPAEYTGFKEPSHAEDDSGLLIKAYEICKGAGYASVSELQRALRIGYTRAARMIEAMHDSGLIADPDETGKRKWIGKQIDPAPFDDAPNEEPELREDEEAAEQAHEEAKEPTNPLIDFADRLCSTLPDTNEQTPQDDANIEDAGIDDDLDPRD